MEDKLGVKETKEVLIALLKISGLLFEQLKDGFQMEDLPVILSKMGYSPEVRLAMEGLRHVPEEVKDLDMAEGFELAMVVMEELPNVLKKANRKLPEPDSDL